MNIELLADDIAKRIPAMKQDSTINNANTIKAMIEPAIKEAFEAGQQDYKIEVNAFMYYLLVLLCLISAVGALLSSCR